MAGIKELAVGRSDMFRVDPRILKVDEGFNVRMASAELTAHIEMLAKSITENGVRVPLVVRTVGNDVFVVHGHCRLSATLLAIERGAEIKSVPVLVEDRNISKEERVFSMITNNDGKPLTFFERAEVYNRLIGWGWNVTQIAGKCGKSDTHVDACLTLAAAPVEIKQLVLAGKVAPSLAIKLIKEHGAEKALEQMKGAVVVAEKAGKEKATKKHTEGAAAALKAGNEAKVNWKTWGPKLYHALEAIVTCPAKGKGSENLGDYLSQGNELIQQMEDEGYKGKE